MLLNLLSAVGRAKHLLNEVMLIKTDLVLWKPAVYRKGPIVYFAGVAALIFAMVIWAVSFAAFSARRILVRRSALLHPIVERMVLLLLPAVAATTSVFKFASILIGFCIFLCLPGLTLVFAVIVKVRLASKVLPIMCIDTNLPLVVLITDWAPNSFEVEHVKVRVPLNLIKYIYWEFWFFVGKSTHVSIVATVYSARVRLAKLALVLFRVIKVFNPVVCSSATVFLGTIPRLIANLTCVSMRRSSAVLLVCFVVEKAFLRIVLDLIPTGLRLESHQVEKDHTVFIILDSTRLLHVTTTKFSARVSMR